MADSTPKSEVILVNVRADVRPTIDVPTNVVMFENSSRQITISVNSGYPVPDRFRISVHESNLDAVNYEDPLSGQNVPTFTYDSSDFPTDSNTAADIDVTINALEVAGENRAIYYIRFEYSVTDETDETRNVTVYDIMWLFIDQSLPARISIANSHSAYENQNISIPYDIYMGSPNPTTIRHSWHATLDDAINDRNPVTHNRPTVRNSWTDGALRAFNPRGDQPLQQTGTLSMHTPDVTNNLLMYGRLEVVQNGRVVSTATYTLTVTNSVQPSITVGNHTGIEGETISIVVMYVGGRPAPSRWEIGWSTTRRNAEAGTFDLSAGRTPETTFNPATPLPNPSTRTLTITTVLTYVDQDRTYWARLRMVAVDPETGQDTYTDAVFGVTILNRRPAEIVFPDMHTMNELATAEIMGYFIVGVPRATQIEASVHANQANAERDRSPLSGEGVPTVLLSVTDIDQTLDYDARNDIILTIGSPDIMMDEDYGIRVDIIQAEITDDP